LTAGLWPWKLASAKECVTTHRPNVGALKMDGAELGEGAEYGPDVDAAASE